MLCNLAMPGSEPICSSLQWQLCAMTTTAWQGNLLKLGALGNGIKLHRC